MRTRLLTVSSLVALVAVGIALPAGAGEQSFFEQAGAEAKYQQLVELDSDIDTAQQASIEADRVLLDMRAERRELGTAACGT